MANLGLDILGGIITNYGMYIILVIFLWFILVTGREISILRKNIKKMNLDLAKLIKSSDYSKNNIDLVDKISELINSDNYKNIDTFRAQYKKFHRSILLTQDKNNHYYFCSRDIEEYFSVQQIFHVSTIYESYSSILIGLGIIFTLVCIVFGTEELGIKSTISAWGINNHITKIVDGVGSKFLSSIAGITFALLYTLFYNRLKYDLEKNLRVFCNLLHTQGLLPLKTQNQLLYEIKETIANNIVK